MIVHGFLTYHCAFEPVALNVHIIYLNRCQTQKMVATQKICTKLISTYLICYFCMNFLCTLCDDSFNLIYVIEFTQRFRLGILCYFFLLVVLDQINVITFRIKWYSFGCNSFFLRWKVFFFSYLNYVGYFYFIKL